MSDPIDGAVRVFEWLNEYLPPLSWVWGFATVVPMILMMMLVLWVIRVTTSWTLQDGRWSRV